MRRTVLALSTILSLSALTACQATYDPYAEFSIIGTHAESFPGDEGVVHSRADVLRLGMAHRVLVVCEMGDGSEFLGTMAQADAIRVSNPAGFPCRQWSASN
jgi:hypothetical protein